MKAQKTSDMASKYIVNDKVQDPESSDDIVNKNSLSHYYINICQIGFAKYLQSNCKDIQWLHDIEPYHLKALSISPDAGILEIIGKEIVKKARVAQPGVEDRSDLHNTDTSKNISVTESNNELNAGEELKKAARDLYSNVIDKSKEVKDVFNSGKYKEVLDNELIRSVTVWFRASDARLRIPVYIGWGQIFGLLIAFLGESLSRTIPVCLTMALYVYALGAVGGPLHWILTLVNKIPYAGLFTMPFFTIPWYVFGWPSEKFYNMFFYKFSCLAVGLRYVQEGEYHKALFELENAKVRKDDTEGQKLLYSALGDAYVGISDYDKAVRAYDTAIQLDPEDTGLKMDLAYCLTMKSDCDDALKLFREVLKVAPENTNAYLGMSLCYIYMQMYADSMTYLNQALSLEPQNATIYKMLAETHLGSGNKADALTKAQLCLTLKPEPDILKQAQEIIDYITNGSAITETADEELNVEQSHYQQTAEVETPISEPRIDIDKITNTDKSTVESGLQMPANNDNDKNMNCSNSTCSKEIPRDSVLCGYCGSKVLLA